MNTIEETLLAKEEDHFPSQPPLPMRTKSEVNTLPNSLGLLAGWLASWLTERLV